VRLTTSGTIASTAGYCALEPLRKNASTATTPIAYNALLSTMMKMTGQSILVVATPKGFPALKIRQAIAPAYDSPSDRGKWNLNREMRLPEQSTLVDIVRAKYAVIHDVATWKMSMPWCACTMNWKATEPTAVKDSLLTA
jgi:hypothetical protein